MKKIINTLCLSNNRNLIKFFDEIGKNHVEVKYNFILDRINNQITEEYYNFIIIDFSILKEIASNLSPENNSPENNIFDGKNVFDQNSEKFMNNILSFLREKIFCPLLLFCPLDSMDIFMYNNSIEDIISYNFTNKILYKRIQYLLAKTSMNSSEIYGNLSPFLKEMNQSLRRIEIYYGNELEINNQEEVNPNFLINIKKIQIVFETISLLSFDSKGSNLEKILLLTNQLLALYDVDIKIQMNLFLLKFDLLTKKKVVYIFIILCFSFNLNNVNPEIYIDEIKNFIEIRHNLEDLIDGVNSLDINYFPDILREKNKFQIPISKKE